MINPRYMQVITSLESTTLANFWQGSDEYEEEAQEFDWSRCLHDQMSTLR